MDEKTKKSSERLAKVLRTEFCGDKALMAYCANVGYTTLQNYLTGKSKPSQHGMYRLAEVIGGYSPEWLAGESDKNEGHDGITSKDYSMLSDIGKRDYNRAKALQSLMRVVQEEHRANSKYERVRLEALMAKAQREYESAKDALRELGDE